MTDRVVDVRYSTYKASNVRTNEQTCKSCNSKHL